MADTGIFCTSGALLLKVGENYDATGFTLPNTNQAIAQAESVINAVCRYNFSDSYAGLNIDVKKLLEEAAACWASIDFISFNMAGYTSRVEAEDMISILWAKFWKIIEILRDQKVVTFINGA